MSLTLADLDQFVKDLKDKRAEADQVKDSLTELNKAISLLEAKAVALLKELGRKNFTSPSGTITVEQKWRVNLPSSDQAKLKLFAHLQDRGIYEKYATVNSNSLNSLYLADWEEAKKDGRGMEFSMPGVDAPKLHEALKFIKGKTA